MKKNPFFFLRVSATSLFFLFFSTAFCQDYCEMPGCTTTMVPGSPYIDGNHVTYYEQNQYIFANAYQPVFNSSLPTSHPLLDNKWFFKNTISDEFTTPSLNTTLWNTNYSGGANSKVPHMSINKATGNHLFSSEYDVMGQQNIYYIRLLAKKETTPYNAKLDNNIPANERLSDGYPNQRDWNYTSAMLELKDASRFKYGYAEIRCRMPKSRNIISDFWLWSANGGGQADDYYNEIDVFETENADDWHQTTHWQTGLDPTYYHNYKFIHAADNQGFSDEFQTFSVRWEPDKAIYYLNNKIMRVVRNHIPNHVMTIYANIEMDDGYGATGRSVFTDDIFPNNYDIDYVRIYQRTSVLDPSSIPSYSTFTLNGVRALSNGLVYKMPGVPIIFNGIESYESTNTFTLKVERLNANLVPVAMITNTLTPGEVDAMQSIDFTQYCVNHAFALQAATNYRVTLFAGTDNSSLMFKTPIAGTSNVSFVINGLDYTSNVNPNLPQVDIEYDYGFPKVILDASKSYTNSGSYQVSIQQSSSGGVGFGTIFSATLNTSQQADLFHNHFDLRAFAQGLSLIMDYNRYYIVTIRTGSPSEAKQKLLYIRPVTPTINFSINNKGGGTTMTQIDIPYVHHQPELYIEGYNCKTQSLQTAPYFVSIQLSDQWWGNGGPEYSQYVTTNDVKRINIRQLARNGGIFIDYGQYYRVKIATGPVWTDRTVLLHLLPCTDHPDFTIEGLSIPGSGFISVCATMGKVRLSAYPGKSCYSHANELSNTVNQDISHFDSYYFLSVQESNMFGTPVPGSTEVTDWLNDAMTEKMDWQVDKHLGYYDLNDFLISSGVTFTAGHYYKIKLCTNGRFDLPADWQCREAVIYIDGGCRIADMSTNSESQLKNHISVFPNPSNGSFAVEHDGTDEAEYLLQLINLDGKIIKEEKFTGKGVEISESGLTAGLYLARIISDDGSFFSQTRLEIMK